MKKNYVLVVLLTFYAYGMESNWFRTSEFVTYKSDSWEGANDLSFKYKMDINDNILELSVDVFDENVLFKDGTIASDHVELWLFDPTLLNTVDEHRIYLENIANVNYSKDDSINNKENYSNTILAKEKIEWLKKMKVAHQYIYNPETIITFPEYRLNDDIDYSYTKTIQGYKFELKQSLTNSFSFCDYQLKNIGYLISISDIDDSNCVRQDNLMCSSKNAKFNKPYTFNILEEQHTLEIPWVIRKEDVIYLLSDDSYLIYDIRNWPFKHYEYAGGYENGFKRFVPQNLYKDEKIAISADFKTLKLKKNHLTKEIELGFIEQEKVSEYIFSDFREKENFYYLVFYVRYPSKWPSTFGYCGCGDESILCYYCLDNVFDIIKSDIYPINSCGFGNSISAFHDKEMEFNEDLSIKSKDNNVKIWTGELDLGKFQYQIIYDLQYPENGFQITESAIKKDK